MVHSRIIMILLVVTKTLRLTYTYGEFDKFNEWVNQMYFQVWLKESVFVLETTSTNW